MKNLFLGFFLFFSSLAFAQTPDQEISNARKLAVQGNRKEAKSILQRRLKANPGDFEAFLLLGRIYAWGEQYDSSIVILENLNSKHTNNTEVINALTDVYFWKGDYSKALMSAEKGLSIQSSSKEFQLKKAQALSGLEKNKEALEILKELQKNDKGENLVALINELELKSRKNTFASSYDIDLFDKTYTKPWQLISVWYQRKNQKITYLGRINLANRFNQSGIQYEVDLYPKLSKRFYAYLNGGISPDSVFPSWRYGASLYTVLPAKFEFEIGLRELYFNETIVFFVSSLSKYWDKYWFSFRPYINPDKEKFSQAYSFIIRRYLKRPESYIGLTLTSGVSPDERTRNYLLNTGKLRSNRIQIEIYQSLKSFFVLSGKVGYAKEEFSIRSENSTRSDISIGVGLQKKF